MNYIFKVKITESEAGWEQKSAIESYNSYEEAVAVIEAINSKNASEEVPSFYLYAEPFNFEIQK